MNHLIIGETCLLKYQLTRVGIKTDATDIFDDMMVNLDGVSGIVENDFEDLLAPKNIENVNYLYYPSHGIWHRKPINTKYTVDRDGMYSWNVCSFFHFDVQTQEAYNSLARKLDRAKSKFESDIPLTLYYYHRYHPNQNIPKLKQKLESFLDSSRKKYGKHIKVTLITQEQGSTKSLRIDSTNEDFYHGHFTTRDSWVGVDDNWDAHTDNDLFDLFFGGKQ